MQGGHHESWQGSCSCPSPHFWLRSHFSLTAPLRGRLAPLLCVPQPRAHFSCQQPTGGLPVLALPRCCCVGSGNVFVLFLSGGYLDEGFVSFNQVALSRTLSRVATQYLAAAATTADCMLLTAIWHRDLVLPSEVGANAQKGTKRKPVVSSFVAARPKGIAHDMGNARRRRSLRNTPRALRLCVLAATEKRPPRPVGVTGSKSTLSPQERCRSMFPSSSLFLTHHCVIS